LSTVKLLNELTGTFLNLNLRIVQSKWRILLMWKERNQFYKSNIFWEQYIFESLKTDVNQNFEI
jgi:hypothetical protein